MRRTRSIRRAVLVGSAALATVAVPIAPAEAAVSIATSMTVPTGVAVGQTNLAGSFRVTNQNTTPNQSESDTVTDIRLAPSCGSGPVSGNACPNPDPGVFSVNSPASGAAGTACAGVNFTVSAPDAAGIRTFTPSSTVVLAPGAGCTVNFTLNVLKVPTIDADPPAPGVQTRVNLRIKATSASGLQLESGPSVVVTVNRATPGLSTKVFSSYVPAGGVVSDKATLTGVPNVAAPTGSVTFEVFGPDNATCSGTPVAQSTNAVAAGTASSNTFPITQPGVYRFLAAYGGDIRYAPRTSGCGDTGEVVIVTATQRSNLGDYNGDGRTDIAVFRPSTGAWFVQGQIATGFGGVGDIPVPGDYNGDGRTDLAVFRQSTGTWYVQNQFATAFGQNGDVPVPADYNGDGRTDLAVYRPTTGAWYVQNLLTTTWGVQGDIPVPGDYNDDGRFDVAVFRPSTGGWFVQGQFATGFGGVGDIPTPGDYNGDGRTDLAIFRRSTGTWYVQNQFAAAFGQNGDVPVPGDYNADGRTDLAVYRPGSTGVWFIQNQFSTSWGNQGDIPLPLPWAIYSRFFGGGGAA